MNRLRMVLLSAIALVALLSFNPATAQAQGISVSGTVVGTSNGFIYVNNGAGVLPVPIVGTSFYANGQVAPFPQGLPAGTFISAFEGVPYAGFAPAGVPYPSPYPYGYYYDGHWHHHYWGRW